MKNEWLFGHVVNKEFSVPLYQELIYFSSWIGVDTGLLEWRIKKLTAPRTAASKMKRPTHILPCAHLIRAVVSICFAAVMEYQTPVELNKVLLNPRKRIE